MKSAIGRSSLAPKSFESELNEAIDQVPVGKTRRRPEFRIHRDRREAGHRIDLVAQKTSAVLFVEEVDSSQTVGT